MVFDFLSGLGVDVSRVKFSETVTQRVECVGDTSETSGGDC